MLLSTLDILNDVEFLFDSATKEHVLKHAVQGVPNYPTQILIDSINGELIRLHMPYLIKILAHDHQELVWIVEYDLNPTLLNWNEKVYFDDRGEVIYQLLLEPFKASNLLIYPKTLENAMELFQINYSDNWQLKFYRDWLLAINKTLYPQVTEGTMNILMNQFTFRV